MNSSSPIPSTAPFAEEKVEILNRVVGPASPTQRAWLAGFLAGMDAATTAPQPAAGPQPAEPLTILYATESGHSEQLASDMAKAARKMGLKPSIVDMADLDVATLASVRRLVVIAATWDEGDPPARAIRAYGELMGKGAPRLDGVEFGFDGAAPPYKPGDSLAIYPENDAAYVDDLLKAAGLASATALRVEMINDRDITTLSLKPRQSYTAAPGHPQVKTLLDSGHARAWIAGRQLIDLLQAFPAALSADQLAGDTTAGAPRLLHRFLAPRRGGGGASTDLRSALPERRALAQGRCFRLRRRPVEERAAAAREVAAQPAFRAARAGPRHHHDRAGHRHCTLPRLRVGAPRHRHERPLLAILRRPPIQPRFSQSARIAG